MGLRNYTETFQMSKKKLYAVICVYHKMSYMTKSPVNDGLAKIITELKKELTDYARIEVAYVYETSSLMSAKPFSILAENTQPYFKEPCDALDTHDLSHVFFMGMAMLRQANKDENADYRLYLVTDEPEERVNLIVWQTESPAKTDEDTTSEKRIAGNETTINLSTDAAGIIMNPGFEDVHAQFVLVRPENIEGGLLEEYIRQSRKGKVVEM